MATASFYAGDQDPVLEAIRRRKQAAGDPGTGSVPLPEVPPPAYEPPAPAPVSTRPPIDPMPAPAPAPPVDKGMGSQSLAPVVDRPITDPLPPELTGQAAADSGLPLPATVDKGFGTQSASVGHNDTYNGQTREQYRDAWMSSGVHDIAGLKAWVAQHGGSVVSDNGTVMTPYGETIDMLIGAKTGNGMPGWTGSGGGGGGSASAAGDGAGGASAAGGSFQDQTRQMLLDLMSQYSKPVTASDPAIAGELQSQQRTAEQTRVQRRSADAERAAFQGLLNGGQSSGAFDTNIASGFQDKGQQLSDVTAQLFSRELTARRDKLQAALTLAVQTGDAESARALQLQIAQMNADIQRQSLAQQMNIHNDDYGLAAAEAQRQRDLDAARARAGGF